MTTAGELDRALHERYRLERELGQGGMATVYLALDRKHDRQVALKVLRPELAASLGPERFLREIHIAARLQHPHILPIFDSGESAGRLWYTMPYVEGPSLRDRLREGRVPLDEALRLAREVALALDHAHRRGVIHRDVKPENILLSEGHALVADFGIARAVNQDGEALTRTGIALGTPLYMSPEQASADAADARSDLYSVACTLYEMLTGAPPFAGETPQAVMVKRFTQPAPSARTVRPDLPAGLDRALTRALERDPADRFATLAEFAAALEPGGSPPAGGPRGARSIAVLPFATQGDDAETAYFGDAMADEILNALAKVTALRVASRTSSFAFKGRNEDIAEIARRLRVTAVLEGSVRRAGNRIRVGAQLVDAEEGFQLWSERYDRELADVFAIQDEIAASIVAALRVVLTERERAALPVERTDLRAYEYYLRGRELAHRVRRESWEGALRMFEQAVAIDPAYARAYAGIADCYTWIHMYYQPTEATLRQAHEASRRALELDPNSAEAHASRGFALSLDKRYDEARAELARAIELSPTLYEAHYLSGRVSWAEGKPEEAERHFREAAAVRPDDFQAVSLLGTVYDQLSQPERAHEAYRQTVERARRHLELYPGEARARYHGAIALRRLGEDAEARVWADRALATAGDDSSACYNLGCFYALGGEPDRAFECLERAVACGYSHREWLEHDSDLETLRGDLRWPALLARFPEPGDT
jgi:eukaryotic-like serine/threonine-protein kinase